MPPNRPSVPGMAKAVVAVLSMVSVVVEVLPDGVTVAGEKLQDAPAGKPVHANETAAENPFCGAMDTVVVPLCPGLIDSDDGESEIPKSAAGKLIV